jgi:hypothetical protein
VRPAVRALYNIIESSKDPNGGEQHDHGRDDRRARAD